MNGINMLHIEAHVSEWLEDNDEEGYDIFRFALFSFKNKSVRSTDKTDLGRF